MILTRPAAVLAVTATLLGAAIPAAQARTFGQLQAPNSSGNWFDAVVTWLGAPVATVSPGAVAHRTPATKSSSVPTGPQLGGPGLGGVHPNTGPGLDPNGHCGGCGVGG
jgi:hypothetical protein